MRSKERSVQPSYLDAVKLFVRFGFGPSPQSSRHWPSDIEARENASKLGLRKSKAGCETVGSFDGATSSHVFIYDYSQMEALFALAHNGKPLII